MTFYEELQLNQAGSKELIRNSQNNKEKLRHLAIYLVKIFITMVFCMAFVIAYSKFFGICVLRVLADYSIYHFNSHDIKTGTASAVLFFSGRKPPKTPKKLKGDKPINPTQKTP